MTSKIFIAMGIAAAASMASASSASAAGAAGSARAHQGLQAESLVKSVALSPRGIRRSLQARGYYNINFTDRRLPVYRVRACKRGKRYSIRLNRWGTIRNRVRIGNCHSNRYRPFQGLSFPAIRHKLRGRGYYNIRFTDRQLPGYRAQACKRGRRFTLWLNRFGDIRDRERRGWCRSGSRYDGPYLNYEGPGFSVTLRKGKKH